MCSTVPAFRSRGAFSWAVPPPCQGLCLPSPVSYFIEPAASNLAICSTGALSSVGLIGNVLSRTGGGSGAEIKGGRTSDGKRRLVSMKDLFAPKDGTAAKSPGLFSRDGVLKLVGYGAVGYFGKQFFNGGRYDDSPDLTGQIAVITVSAQGA
jgi:hypothetical protein